MMGGDIWEIFAVRLSDRIGQLIESRLRSFADKYCRSAIKVVYSETEASAWLGVSKATLQEWRKRGVISYCRYPAAKTDALSDMYAFSLVDLMEFTEKYRVNAIGKNVYQFKKDVSPFGAEIERAKAA